MIFTHIGLDGRRLSLQWVSAAEGIRFVEVITAFDHAIRELGPLGQSEGIERNTLIRRIRASRMATESMRFRMAFAKQAKQIKEENRYGELPEREKLLATFSEERLLYEALICLQEGITNMADLSRQLDRSEEQVNALVETLKKKKLWEPAVCEA